MLKRNRSLTLRAALIFLPIYVATFVGGLLFFSSASLSFEEDHHTGPRMALTFAADDIYLENGSPRLRSSGPFSELAARNPSLWIIAQLDGRLFSYGSVPNGARPLFHQYRGTLEAGRFHVPGLRRPISDASIEARYTRFGTVLVAAGGVDPTRISFAHTFRYFLNQGVFIFLLALGVVGLLTMLIALPLLTSALKPVIADAAAIQPEKRDNRINERGVPRELLPLVRALNSALDRLADELVRRKRFIADVAHELRTPIAILTLQVEAMKETEAKRDMTRVLTRLSNLVAQMLDAERLSLAGTHGMKIDLAELARDVVVEMAPMAISAGYDLSLSAPDDPVVVTGDRHALTRAMGNLISNSVAHGRSCGRISVLVGEQRTIDVLDEGPGVPAAIRDTLFEPFQRGRWDRDGCGLGLHLVSEVMRAHGGEALLLDSPKGALFRLQFTPPDTASKLSQPIGAG